MLFPHRNEEKTHKHQKSGCPSPFRGSAFVQSRLETINRVFLLVCYSLLRSLRRCFVCCW